MAVIRKTDWAVNTGPVEYDTVNEQAVPVRRVAESDAVMGDWKYLNGEWLRVPLVGAGRGAFVRPDDSEPGVFRALVCGTLLGGRFTCPDDARENADAYLVGAGRLDKSRAFVRLGEWEPAPECGHGYMMRRQASGAAPLTMTACGEKGRASSDASAVANRWLDPSRAFKAGPTSSASLAEYIPAVEAVFRKLSSHTINQPAKPAWGEWERGGDAFVRRPSDQGAMPVGAFEDRWSRGLGFVAVTDIDDAREKADAFLVARGELEAGRAFKRVGDWAPDKGAWHRFAHDVPVVQVDRYGWGVPTTAGVSGSMGNETGDAGKAAADAELVRRGLLAESRAFKVEPRPLMTAERTLGLASGQALDAMGLPREPGETDEALRARWHALLSRPVWHVPASLTAQRTITLGPGEVITIPRPITEHTIVTLANWERCLPHLLSGAPREFRDGFNRKQGPAWEAYLVALAGVKEQVQCNRYSGPAVLGDVVLLAADRARYALGAEWVKANVR